MKLMFLDESGDHSLLEDKFANKKIVLPVLLIKTYSSPANPYHLCFQFILERAIMFLGRDKDSIILRAESILLFVS